MKSTSMSRPAIVAGAWLTMLAIVGHAADGDPDAGAELYSSVCKGCHGVSIAPTLRGVVGRRIASVEAFPAYTSALKAKQNLTWTAELLDKFLQAPAQFAPGTAMTQVLADAQARADVIAYLATLPPPR